MKVITESYKHGDGDCPTTTNVRLTNAYGNWNNNLKGTLKMRRDLSLSETEDLLSKIEASLLFDPAKWSFGEAGVWPRPKNLVADFPLEKLPQTAGKDLVALLKDKYGITATIHETCNVTPYGTFINAKFTLRVAQTESANEVAKLEAAFELTRPGRWILNTITKSDGEYIKALNLPLKGFNSVALSHLKSLMQRWAIPWTEANSSSLAQIVNEEDGGNDKTVVVLRIRGWEIDNLRKTLPFLLVTWSRDQLPRRLDSIQLLPTTQQYPQVQ